MRTSALVVTCLAVFALASCSKEEPAAEPAAAAQPSEAAPAEAAPAEEGAPTPTSAPTEAAAAAGGPAVQASGTLEQGDSLYPEDQSYYDEYTFDAAAGDKIVVTMDSEAFDTYLHLLGPGGLHEMNDDYGDGTNSRIEYTATAAGTYRVYANALWAPQECEPATPGGEPTCEFSGPYNVSVTVGE